MEPNDYVLESRAAVINVSPYGYIRYAKEFLQAAQTIPRQEGFSPVPYYLLCRTLELGLKAFILAKGGNVEGVKNELWHDLVKALAKAKTLGLHAIVSISPDEECELSKANDYYKGKGFEYFQIGPAVTGYPQLPNLSALENVASRLVAAASPVCIECT